QTGGLAGPEKDVERMCSALDKLGFESRICVGSNASREGIFDEYQRLIGDASVGDAALVYYSGHGGFAPNPAYRPMDASGLVRPRSYQFIVPYDIDESTDDDFRGIVDVELSALLA